MAAGPAVPYTWNTRLSPPCLVLRPWSGPRQIRTQLFRVYHVEMDTRINTVKAWARHI